MFIGVWLLFLLPATATESFVVEVNRSSPVGTEQFVLQFETKRVLLFSSSNFLMGNKQKTLGHHERKMSPKFKKELTRLKKMSSGTLVHGGPGKHELTDGGHHTLKVYVQQKEIQFQSKTYHQILNYLSKRIESFGL